MRVSSIFFMVEMLNFKRDCLGQITKCNRCKLRKESSSTGTLVPVLRKPVSKRHFPPELQAVARQAQTQHSKLCLTHLRSDIDIKFEALSDHEALRIQVNDRNDAASSGKFGREAHVAEPNLVTVAVGFYICQWKSSVV